MRVISQPIFLKRLVLVQNKTVGWGRVTQIFGPPVCFVQETTILTTSLVMPEDQVKENKQLKLFK